MMKRLAIIIVLLIGFSNSVAAQEYKYDIGAGVGMSGYMGDVNQFSMYKNPGFGANAIFRYIMNYRWSLKSSFSTAGISGNSADFENVLPAGAQYNFKSQLYDLGTQMEFNFFNYGIGYKYKNLKRLVPYLGLGVGFTLASVQGDGAAFALNIPMSVGVKYKAKERLNLGLDFSMRKVVGSNIDGFDLGELNGIERSKNSNWYSLLMFTVSYEIGKRCIECHYID